MIRWNKTTALLTGLAMIVVGNTIALTGIYYNRTGDDTKITMTQRELHLPYYYYDGFQSENSGVAFTLEWRTCNDNFDCSSKWENPAWLNKRKLSELGFDTDIPFTARHAERRYHKMLPREAYVVLEYNGPTYAKKLKQAQGKVKLQQRLSREHPKNKKQAKALNRAKTALANEQHSLSHLFAVDAGADRDALRRRYPNRSMYIIATAQVSIALNTYQTKPKLIGSIAALNIDSITAPYAIRRQLEPYLGNNNYRKRQKLKYKVTVAYGKRLEPWITDFAITARTGGK